MTDRITAYIRTKATKLRDRYDGNKLVRDGQRDRFPTEAEISTALDIARQLDITADEIDAGFHDD